MCRVISQVHPVRRDLLRVSIIIVILVFMWIWFTKSRGKQYKNLIIIIMIITLIIIPHGAERSEFIISSQYVNRVWVQASCKLAAFIFIYPMVSAMTSYNSLTSRRNFVSRQHSTESDYDQSIHEELSFHRLQNNVYYR